MVLIISLLLNRWEYTRIMLGNLFKYADDDFRLVLLDNGSTDDTVKEVDNYLSKLSSEFCKSVEVIKLEKNIGISGGLNYVLNECKDFDYFMKFDNDVIVLTPFLKKMKEALEKVDNLGAIAINQEVDYEKYTLLDFGSSVVNDVLLQIKDDFIHFGVVMIPKKVISELGKFTEYGIYGHTQADTCSRIRMFGYYLAYHPELIAFRADLLDDGRDIDFTLFKTKEFTEHYEEAFKKIKEYEKALEDKKTKWS